MRVDINIELNRFLDICYIWQLQHLALTNGKGGLGAKLRDKAEFQIHFSRVHDAPVMAQPCNFMTVRSWVESLRVLGIFYSSQNVRQAELPLGEQAQLGTVWVLKKTKTKPRLTAWSQIFYSTYVRCKRKFSGLISAWTMFAFLKTSKILSISMVKNMAMGSTSVGLREAT